MVGLLWVGYENDVININFIFKAMVITIFSTFSKGQQVRIAPQFMKAFNSLSASLLLNIYLSFEVGIAHAIANFK